MVLPSFLAETTLLVACFVVGCTTADVDPSSATRAHPTVMVAAGGGASTAPDTTSPASTWVARDNPTLLPASGDYSWKNVVILGGGFVSGVAFSPAGTLYARTDVGGAYRWDDGANGAADGHWVALEDWAGRADSNVMGVESIAPDPIDPNTVYLAVGEYLTAGAGQILSSNDRGTTWTRNAIGVPMGGNADGRSLGERLAVDPNLPSTLYFASRSLGLWRSLDSAATWQAVSGFPVTGDASIGLSFVLFDARSGRAGVASPVIYVGVATTTAGALSLYRSSDAGVSFAPVPGAPTGLTPHHAALDSEGTLYLAYSNGPGPNNITTGAVWKMNTANDTWTDITPLAPDADHKLGYAGLSLDAQHPGTVVVTTLDYWRPDLIFRSTKGGAPGSWAEIGASVRDAAGAEYLYWHRGSVVNGGTGWAANMAIDPTHPDRAVYGTGQGLWWSDDLTASDTNRPTHWTFRDFGLEETVPLALLSPPSGPHLLSGLGDLGGFRHDDLDAPPASGMFSNPVFSNTTSLDFAELDPTFVARVGTGGDATRGAFSSDGGVTWSPFATEPSGSNGSGTIAVAADGSALLWVPRRASSSAAATYQAFNYSTDHGATWSASSGIAAGARGSAVSDRVNPLKFYALAGAAVYASVDGATSFVATGASVTGAASLHCVYGHEGDVWLVAGDGLYHSLDSGQTFSKLDSTTSAADVSFGRAKTDSDYPALYLAGTVDGLSGILRSDDAGTTWTRIDDDAHRFGYISHVSGDPRIYGRVYLGTGGRGIIYGDAR